MVMLEAAAEVGAVCKTLGFCVCFPMSACTLLFEEQEAEKKHLVKKTNVHLQGLRTIQEGVVSEIPI